MSIEVIYQGLTIAKDPKFRLQDGGVYLEVEGPMPVATQLSLVHGEHTLAGRVRRVTEGAGGAGAGMLVVPTQTSKLPRWLLPLGPLSVNNVELEPEPVVVAKPEPKHEAKAKAEAKAETKAEAKPEAEPKAEAAPPSEAAEALAPSGHTPSEHEAAGKDDEEDDKAAKGAAQKPGANAPNGANAKKKKGRKR